MPPEEASLRDALNNAFDKHDEEAQESKATEEESTPTPQELMDGTPGDQENAGESESGKDEEEKETTEETVQASKEKAEETEQSAETEETQTSLKAPASWSPKAKEDWSKVPANLQQEIIERERAYSVGIQKNAESAKFGDRIRETLAPYQHIMSAEGSDEVQAVANLAQHAAIMRYGTNMQKAQTIANIIGMYDVDIQMLDSMLAGEEVDDGGISQIQNILDQRLGPLEQMLRQGQQSSINNIQETNRSEIEAFAADAKNEFFEDVREQMADIIDVRAAQGKDCTLQEAYDIAIMMNPEIQEILGNRKQQESLQNNQNKLQGKKAAASSVSGSANTSTAGGEEPKTLRGAVADAWDKVEGDTGSRI